MKPVDIVVLNYNSGGMLEKCIFNLKKTNYPIHIFVVDNGSRDCSTDFLTDHSDVTLVKNPRNLGCPAGLNRVLPILRGEYVAFLNEDIFPYVDWLDHIIPLFEENPRVGAVGMKLLRPDGSVEADGSYIDPVTCSAAGLKGGLDGPTPVPYTGLGNIVVRRSVFDEIGPFEEMFFLYWDDVEFCIRLWRAGYKVLHCPRSQSIHLHRWSARRNLPQLVINQFAIRNSFLTLLAYATQDELRSYLPTLFLLKAIRVVRLMMKRDAVNSTSHLLAFIGVLRKLDWVVEKRRGNESGKMTLTDIAEISPDDPPFFAQEHYLARKLRQRARK